MALQKVAGSKIFIGPKVLYKTNVTLTDFAGLTWTEIGQWQQTGDLGAEQQLITQTLINENTTLYAKGNISFPIMSNTFAPDPADAGQTAFLAAQRDPCRPYAFKIEWSADCTSTATVTISTATPGVVTWPAHGLINGTPVSFTTTGALPTGLTAGTTYYVVAAATDTFQVAATIDGTPINTTSAGSGVHAAYAQPLGETDLLFGLAMFGTKTGGDAAAMRLVNYPIQPIALAVTI